MAFSNEELILLRRAAQVVLHEQPEPYVRPAGSIHRHKFKGWLPSDRLAIADYMQDLLSVADELDDNGEGSISPDELLALTTRLEIVECRLREIANSHL